MTKLVNFDAEILSYSLEDTQPRPEWALGLAKGFVRALLGLAKGFVRTLLGLAKGFVRALLGLAKGFVRAC